jgi:hypothetical protein
MAPRLLKSDQSIMIMDAVRSGKGLTGAENAFAHPDLLTKSTMWPYAYNPYRFP